MFKGEEGDSRPRLDETRTIHESGSRKTKKLITGNGGGLRLRSQTPQSDDDLYTSDNSSRSREEAPNDPTYHG